MLTALTLRVTSYPCGKSLQKVGYTMSSLQISQGTFRLSDTKTLKIEHLTVGAGESWAFVGKRQREVGAGSRAVRRAHPVRPR
jgi:molybdate transport system ATP-binding protein